MEDYNQLFTVPDIASLISDRIPQPVFRQKAFQEDTPVFIPRMSSYEFKSQTPPADPVKFTKRADLPIDRDLSTERNVVPTIPIEIPLKNSVIRMVKEIKQNDASAPIVIEQIEPIKQNSDELKSANKTERLNIKIKNEKTKFKKKSSAVKSEHTTSQIKTLENYLKFAEKPKTKKENKLKKTYKRRGLKNKSRDIIYSKFSTSFEKAKLHSSVKSKEKLKEKKIMAEQKTGKIKAIETKKRINSKEKRAFKRRKAPLETKPMSVHLNIERRVKEPVKNKIKIEIVNNKITLSSSDFLPKIKKLKSAETPKPKPIDSAGELKSAVNFIAELKRKTKSVDKLEHKNNKNNIKEKQRPQEINIVVSEKIFSFIETNNSLVKPDSKKKITANKKRAHKIANQEQFITISSNHSKILIELKELKRIVKSLEKRKEGNSFEIVAELSQTPKELKQFLNSSGRQNISNWLIFPLMIFMTECARFPIEVELTHRQINQIN